MFILGHYCSVTLFFLNCFEYVMIFMRWGCTKQYDQYFAMCMAILFNVSFSSNNDARFEHLFFFKDI